MQSTSKATRPSTWGSRSSCSISTRAGRPTSRPSAWTRRSWGSGPRPGRSRMQRAWGEDDTPLVPYHRGLDAKSMGHEVTLAEDCDERGALEGTLLRLADQVARRMRGEGYVGRTVTLKLRDHRFVTVLRQRVLPDFTAEAERIYPVALALLHANWNGAAVRLLGVSVSQLARSGAATQGELFTR